MNCALQLIHNQKTPLHLVSLNLGNPSCESIIRKISWWFDSSHQDDQKCSSKVAWGWSRSLWSSIQSLSLVAHSHGLGIQKLQWLLLDLPWKDNGKEPQVDLPTPKKAGERDSYLNYFLCTLYS